MDQSFTSVLWGLGFSALHIVIVTVALKILKKIAPVLIHAASALASLLLLYFAKTVMDLQFWIAFSVLAFSCSSYLFLFGAVYKSLTLRMLCAAQSSGGSISTFDLNSTVTAPTFTERVSLLNTMGHVAAEKDSYFITEKGRRTVQFFNLLRRGFSIGTKAVYHLDEWNICNKE